MIFPSFLIQEPALEPRNLPLPAGESGSALLFLFTAGCSCFVGANCFDFSPMSFLLPFLPASSPCSSGFYSWRIMVLDRSVS
ncbi:hypothetical protein SLEP1_g35443 [Rubroshorea leprosula]|uniref:Uncharacterized protein n=1 Tax=Rubroshorea leprosula TaxID=152421 RepID=A0AAV5KNK1_9ROSI|nr:hypothetical protein SLEP1_g35443 [Rubroshorea leprosula]